MLFKRKEQETFRGVARNVEWRQQGRGPLTPIHVIRGRGYHALIQVLTVRVEQVDDIGNVTGYVPVEAKFEDFKNLVADGDEVEVTGKMEDGILKLEALSNRTTGATYSKKQKGGCGKYLLAVFILLVAVGVILWYLGWLVW